MKGNMYFRITVLTKCQLLYRDTVAATIRHVCNRLEAQGEPKAFGYQVISAFNEAFNNLVSHGGEGVDEKDVLVTVIVNERQLIIDMEDDSGGFTPPARTPSTHGLRESGMGLSIMREFMDSIDYKKKTKNGINTLRMVRNLTSVPKYV
jgi:anti-sigma regulatory factor (Ser/Thr protein kinase)